MALALSLSSGFGGGKMRYLNGGNPSLGDRVQHTTGRLGRVTEVRPGNRAYGFGELAIKWDDAVPDSRYAFATEFTLMVRALGEFVRIPRNVLTEKLRNR